MGVNKTPTAGGKMCVCISINTRAVAVFWHAFLLLIFCYVRSVTHLHRCPLPFSPTHAAVKTKRRLNLASRHIHKNEPEAFLLPVFQWRRAETIGTCDTCGKASLQPAHLSVKWWLSHKNNKAMNYLSSNRGHSSNSNLFLYAITFTMSLIWQLQIHQSILTPAVRRESLIYQNCLFN